MLPVRRSLALSFSLSLVSCAPLDGRPDADYSRPFVVIGAEYSVPIALGRAMPGVVGGWDDPVTLKRYVQGFTHVPVAHDIDKPLVNYGLHPIAGSETHLLARNSGWSFGASALFDAAGSISWEYLFENVYEPPSRIDLMVTAPAGALLGELRWQLKQAGILPGLMDPSGLHGEPFFRIENDAFIFGIDRRF